MQFALFNLMSMNHPGEAPAEVIAATKEWMKQFDPSKKEDAHALLEALWLFQWPLRY
jgi:hypothetical protein